MSFEWYFMVIYFIDWWLIGFASFFSHSASISRAVVYLWHIQITHSLRILLTKLLSIIVRVPMAFKTWLLSHKMLIRMWHMSWDIRGKDFHYNEDVLHITWVLFFIVAPFHHFHLVLINALLGIARPATGIFNIMDKQPPLFWQFSGCSLFVTTICTCVCNTDNLFSKHTYEVID